MKIKVITKSGKSRILVANDRETIEKIANKFSSWEYKQ